MKFQSNSSKLMKPFRAVGLISDGKPFHLNKLGDENFLIMTIDKSFQVFKCEKLSLSLVSPALAHKIDALAARNHRTYTACRGSILAWERTTQVGELGNHGEGNTVTSLLMIGELLLSLSIAEETGGGELRVWNTALKGKTAKGKETTDEEDPEDSEEEEDEEESQLLACINFGPEFTPSCLAHPQTYLNKVVVGSTQGELRLYNIKSKRLVHNFACLSQKQGQQPPAITVVEPSPALDVAAVGFANGTVILVQLRQDAVLFSFTQSGAVTALSFRTDAGSAQIPMLASGTNSGQVHLWDLKEQRLHTSIEGAHFESVTSLCFLPKEPVLVSSGLDNCLKMWVFDAPDGSARLLRSREGHSRPPSKIRFYGNNTFASMSESGDATGLQVLSAGQDRSFRVFHMIRDCQSREMSQGPLLKKARRMNVPIENLRLRPITGFAAMETRDRDWDNVITCHEDDANVYAWSFKRRAIGKHILRHPDAPTNEMSKTINSQFYASSVCLSACGNFALVGTNSGIVYKYNMQSGAFRGAYPKVVPTKGKVYKAALHPASVAKMVADHSEPSTIEQKDSANVDNQNDTGADLGHMAPVTGIEVDAINSTLVSGSLDKMLKFWHFSKHRLMETVDTGSPISQVELFRDNGLVAVACDDFAVRLFDITTRKLVRRLLGHSGAILDVAFSPDGRRLISAASDRTVRIWDLPTGACFDWLMFKKPATGVSCSPNGEFLATTHAGQLGVYLWTDKSYFSNVHLGMQPTAPVMMEEPVPLAEEQPEARHVEDFFAQEDPDDEFGSATAIIESKKQRAKGAITLSLLPKAHWHTLFNLELIKARNRPVMPPKAPERAPFFLPTIRKDDGVAPGFDAKKKEEEERSDAKKRAEEEEAALAAMSALPSGGAWSDEDEDEDLKEQGMASSDEEQDNEIAAHPTKILSSGSAPPASRILKSGKMSLPRSKLAILLQEFSSSSRNEQVLFEKSQEILEFLMSLGASGVDVELHSLCQGDFDQEGLQLLALMADVLALHLARGDNFEVVQAYLNRYLKIHSEAMAAEPLLVDKIEKLVKVQKLRSSHLRKLVQQNMCLLQFFSNMQS